MKMQQEHITLFQGGADDFVQQVEHWHHNEAMLYDAEGQFLEELSLHFEELLNPDLELKKLQELQHSLKRALNGGYMPALGVIFSHVQDLGIAQKELLNRFALDQLRHELSYNLLSFQAYVNIIVSDALVTDSDLLKGFLGNANSGYEKHQYDILQEKYQMLGRSKEIEQHYLRDLFVTFLADPMHKVEFHKIRIHEEEGRANYEWLELVMFELIHRELDGTGMTELWLKFDPLIRSHVARLYPGTPEEQDDLLGEIYQAAIEGFIVDYKELLRQIPFDKDAIEALFAFYVKEMEDSKQALKRDYQFLLSGHAGLMDYLQGAAPRLAKQVRSHRALLAQRANEFQELEKIADVKQSIFSEVSSEHVASVYEHLVTILGVFDRQGYEENDLLERLSTLFKKSVMHVPKVPYTMYDQDNLLMQLQVALSLLQQKLDDLTEEERSACEVVLGLQYDLGSKGETVNQLHVNFDVLSADADNKKSTLFDESALYDTYGVSIADGDDDKVIHLRSFTEFEDEEWIPDDELDISEEVELLTDEEIACLVGASSYCNDPDAEAGAYALKLAPHKLVAKMLYAVATKYQHQGAHTSAVAHALLDS